jgi:phage-related baseplate assembly protein
VSDGIRRWRSTNAGTLVVPAGGQLDIEVRAEVAGDAYNVAVGAITVVIAPAFAGLSVTNPAIGATGTWITTAGAAEESDAALRQRCRDRWSTLGAGATADAYRYLLRTTPGFEAQITRVAVLAGPGDGTITCWLASASGPSSAGAVAAATTRILAAKPLTDSPTILPAVALPVQVAGPIQVRAADDSPANRARATDALAALGAGLGIEGATLDLGALYAAIYAARGIVDVDLTLPAGDTAVPFGSVAVLDVSGLVWVPV